MYIGTFEQFIFESYQDPIVDFCLDIFNQYRKRGKSFEDLPLEVKQCIRSNGQTDVSRRLEKIYYQYQEDGETFSSFPDIVSTLSAEADPVEELADIIVENRGKIQFSFIPMGISYHLVLIGDTQFLEQIYYYLTEFFQEGTKLISYKELGEQSEIVLDLEEEEVDIVRARIYSN